MITNRSITCTNKDGDAVTFTENTFSPFLLISADGVYDSDNEVNLMDNAIIDGAIYQNSRTTYRNIVLTVCDVSSFEEIKRDQDIIYITAARIVGKTLEILSTMNPGGTSAMDYINNRALLDKVFKKNELGRLTIIDGDKKKVIDYYVEKITSTGSNAYRTHTISLICPDPYFYDPSDISFIIGEIKPNFKFFHEFVAAGEEFGQFEAQSGLIHNDSMDNIGFTVTISGASDIVNPGISKLETGEKFQIGTVEDPYTLSAGDTLIITTGTGNKHAYLIHGETTTEINYLLSYDSSFFQLMRGDNTLYFLCNSGRNSASVIITYRLRYVRA